MVTGPAAPIDRAGLDAVIIHELVLVSVGPMTARMVNRARRNILAAADAYRAWMPDADPPTPTQLALAAGRRSQLRLALIHTTDHRRQERPSP